MCVYNNINTLKTLSALKERIILEYGESYTTRKQAVERFKDMPYIPKCVNKYYTQTAKMTEEEYKKALDILSKAGRLIDIALEQCLETSLP